MIYPLHKKTSFIFFHQRDDDLETFYLSLFVNVSEYKHMQWKSNYMFCSLSNEINIYIINANMLELEELKCKVVRNYLSAQDI